jgi:hypothetical protein
VIVINIDTYKVCKTHPSSKNSCDLYRVRDPHSGHINLDLLNAFGRYKFSSFTLMRGNIGSETTRGIHNFGSGSAICTAVVVERCNGK